MTAPRRRRRPWPDPRDPANLAWWQAHDRLSALADDARELTAAAHAAYDTFLAGQQPQLDELTALADRCWSDHRCFDIVVECFQSLPDIAGDTAAAP